MSGYDWSQERANEMLEEADIKNDLLAAENEALRKELEQAREAIRSAPLMVDVSGVPLHRDGLTWIKLPAVRAALEGKKEGA